MLINLILAQIGLDTRIVFDMKKIVLVGDGGNCRMSGTSSFQGNSIQCAFFVVLNQDDAGQSPLGGS